MLPHGASIFPTPARAEAASAGLAAATSSTSIHRYPRRVTNTIATPTATASCATPAVSTAASAGPLPRRPTYSTRRGYALGMVWAKLQMCLVQSRNVPRRPWQLAICKSPRERLAQVYKEVMGNKCYMLRLRGQPQLTAQQQPPQLPQSQAVKMSPLSHHH